MPDSSNKLIITSFFLSKGFYPKYHLFKSALLCRIVSISTEQGLFINWDFDPKHRSECKNKKRSHMVVRLFAAYPFQKEEVEYAK